MNCDLCTRAPVGACVGEAFCASLHLTDEEACWQAAEACLSWWQKRDEEVADADDIFWGMSENRIDELACDPQKARAYLAERSLVC
jgi:hypothetical protein